MVLSTSSPSFHSSASFSHAPSPSPHALRTLSIPYPFFPITGSIIASAFDPQSRQASSEKSGSRDLVTATDAAAEAAIMKRLRAAFPDHSFVGEEEASAAAAAGKPTPKVGREPTWCVDPLDGTTNFVHGWPFVCVSIGLVVENVPVVGVVFNPVMGELFVGALGRGATLNGNPIRVSGEKDLSRALIGTEIGVSEDPRVVDAIFGRVRALTSAARSLRCGGSCAQGLCGVACGRLDAFFEVGFGGIWDCAAGAAVLSEAGGFLLDPSGSYFDVDSRRVLGGSSEQVAKDAGRVLAEVELGPEEPQPTQTTR